MAKFYAAANSYASESSCGFANTWYVLVFNSRETRDTYVRSAKDAATRAIKKREIGEYIDRPKPFSGMHWGIHDDIDDDARVRAPGFLGTVECIDKFQEREKSCKERIH